MSYEWATGGMRERLEAASKAFARAMAVEEADEFSWSPEPGEKELQSWREVLTGKR